MVHSCDNTDCKNKLNVFEVFEVEMKPEFEGGKVKWCKDCINRDSDFIQNELYECDFCDNKSMDELSEIEIYHNAFDNEGTVYRLCDGCYNDLTEVDYCESCLKYMFTINGYITNITYDEKHDEMICRKCKQKKYHKKGMKRFNQADFIANIYLEGYNHITTKFCRSTESYERVEAEFNKLKAEGFKVICDMVSNGMGFEHTLALYAKDTKITRINKSYKKLMNKLVR